MGTAALVALSLLAASGTAQAFCGAAPAIMPRGVTGGAAVRGLGGTWLPTARWGRSRPRPGAALRQSEEPKVEVGEGVEHQAGGQIEKVEPPLKATSKYTPEEAEKIGNLVADDEWMGLTMEITELVRVAILEETKKNARDFLGKDDYKVGDISKELDARVKQEVAKLRGKDEYELGDLSVALDTISKEMVCEMTGKDKYEFGDLSTEIDSRVKTSVAKFCGEFPRFTYHPSPAAYHLSPVAYLSPITYRPNPLASCQNSGLSEQMFRLRVAQAHRDAPTWQARRSTGWATLVSK
jgi:hypothetical protein